MTSPVNDPTSTKYPDRVWRHSRWMTPEQVDADKARTRAGHERRTRARTLPLPLIWVYRMYDSDHNCLYVGKTNNLNRRRENYPKESGGAKEAFERHAYMVLEMAEDPELVAIKEHQPKHNRLHSGVTYG